LKLTSNKLADNEFLYIFKTLHLLQDIQWCKNFTFAIRYSVVRSSAPTPQPMNDGSLHTHTSEMPSRAPAPKKLPLFMSSRAPAPIKLPLPSWKYYRTWSIQ